MKRNAVKDLQAEGIKLNIDWFSQLNKEAQVETSPKLKKILSIDTKNINSPKKPAKIWKSKTNKKNSLIKTYFGNKGGNKVIVTSPTNDWKAKQELPLEGVFKISKSMDRSTVKRRKSQFCKPETALQLEMKHKISRLKKFMNETEAKLKNNVNIRNSLAKKTGHFNIRKELEVKGKNKEKPLKVLINHRLSTIEQMVFLKTSILNGEDLSMDLVKMKVKKENTEPRNKIKIKTDLSIREKLQLTGEKNRLLLKSLNKKIKTNTFANELDKRKKLNSIRRFNRVFGKPDKKKEKKIITLQNGIKMRKVFSRKMLPSTMKESRSANQFFTGKENKIKTARSNNMASMDKNDRLLNVKKKNNIMSSLLGFNLIKDLIIPKHFLQYVSCFPKISDHFNNILTKEVMNNFTFPKQFYKEILDRQEIFELKNKVTKYLSSEKILKRRLHMAIIQGVDIAYKIKLVYKEQADFLLFLFANLSDDIEKFKQNVGKTAYKSVQENKREIEKIIRRYDEREKLFETRLRILQEKHEKEKKKGQLQDEERVLMKKLIFELQEKNEKYAETVEKLKHQKDQEFKKKISIVETNQVRSRFKNIVKKIIPGANSSKKLSFVGVAKKLREIHMKDRKRNVFDLIKEDHSETSKPYKTSRGSISRKYNRMDLHKFSQPVSRKRLLYSSDSEESVDERKRKVSIIKSMANKRKKSFFIFDPNSESSQFKYRNFQGNFCARCESKIYQKPFQRKATFFQNYAKDKNSRVSSSAQPQRIGVYLLKDIEQVSKYYTIPDGGTNTKGTQTMVQKKETSTQTNLNLVSSNFDKVLANQRAFLFFVKDYNFRKNLSYERVIDRITEMKKELAASDGNNNPSRKENTKNRLLKNQDSSIKEQELFKNIQRINSSLKVFSGRRGQKRKTLMTPNQRTFDFKEDNLHSQVSSSDDEMAANHVYLTSKTKKMKRNSTLGPELLNLRLYENRRNSRVSQVSFNTKQHNQVDPDREYKKMKFLFENFLRDHLLYDRREWISKENKMIWLAQYLISEEIKYDKLCEKQEKVVNANLILKKLLNPFERKRLKRSQSLISDKLKDFKRKDKLMMDYHPNSSLRKRSLIIIKNDKKCLEFSSYLQRYKKDLKFQIKKDLFNNSCFTNIWSAFKSHLKNKYSKGKHELKEQGE